MPRFIQPLVVLALILPLGGCISTAILTGGGGSGFTSVTEAGSRLTVAEAADVARCQRLGEVQAPPPFALPTDASNTLRNRAAELGADTIVYTNMLIGTAKADAYRCRAA